MTELSIRVPETRNISIGVPKTGNISINGKNYDYTADYANHTKVVRDVAFADKKDVEDFAPIFKDTIAFKDKNNHIILLHADEIDIKSKVGLPKAGDIISFVDEDNNKVEGKVIGSYEDNDKIRGAKHLYEFFHDAFRPNKKIHDGRL